MIPFPEEVDSTRVIVPLASRVVEVVKVRSPLPLTVTSVLVVEPSAPCETLVEVVEPSPA